MIPILVFTLTLVAPLDAQAGMLLRREARLQERLQISQSPQLQIVRLVNSERKKAGLYPLTYNKKLEASAQKHAEDMLNHHYFSHNSQNGSSFVNRMKAEGYGVLHTTLCEGCSFSARFGENIAKGHRTARQVVQGWMNSPPHRKNILSSNFEELGIGITGAIWVQNFGAITFDILP